MRNETQRYTRVEFENTPCPNVRLGMNSQAQRQSLINQTGKGRRARFNLLGLLAWKLISRWIIGLNNIGASYQGLLVPKGVAELEYEISKLGILNSFSLRLERLERETNSYLDSATSLRKCK
ncbi:MAG: hypothetical protein QNJ63_05165 [Calothrix sp. MO_192.B10]|nr:hypothetical protein [Calothrix sp. MO_192.B10]